MAFDFVLDRSSYDLHSAARMTFQVTISETPSLPSGDYLFEIYYYDGNNVKTDIYSHVIPLVSSGRSIFTRTLFASDLSPLLSGVYETNIYFGVSSAEHEAFGAVRIYDSSFIAPSFTAAVACTDTLTVGDDVYAVQGVTRATVTFSATAGTFPVTGYRAGFGNSAPAVSESASASAVPAGYGELPLVYGVRAGGKWFETSRQFTVLSYGRPAAVRAQGESAVVCRRCESGNVDYSPVGTFLGLKFKKSYSALTVGGTARNSATAEASITPDGGQQGQFFTVSGPNDPDGTVYVSPSAVFPSLSSSYTVKIRITDLFSSVETSYRIGAANIPLHLALGGRAVGIGCFAPQSSDRVDIGWPCRLRGGAVENVVYEGETKQAGSVISGQEAYLDGIDGFNLFIMNENVLLMKKYRTANGFSACPINSTAASFTYDRANGSITVGGAGISSLTALI